MPEKVRVAASKDSQAGSGSPLPVASSCFQRTLTHGSHPARRPGPARGAATDRPGSGRPWRGTDAAVVVEIHGDWRTWARLYGSPANPLYQSGTIVIALLLVLIVTGLWLIFFYRVGAPYASVADIDCL